ncbi:SusC/RagA family TonB-linked outer membrane protein [Algoriphagus hitonicola]|uniref:TonB-linked outer membrane protein, SusC/RagA family n=1 Tax=Algoriphagus hitonicola TaxID=435880 RepID=A0A1I2SX06_9BACT|nr:TonB-dependent receptor [Algoriphagus hitonicola]SFG57150.1 TonB-linked outer membrane protein, SusC/RagA family [Algoriphagus hitonicola]
MENNLRRQLIMLSKRLIYAFLIQLFFCTVILANSGNAQRKNIEKVKISMKLQEKSLAEFFNQVESKTDFKFTYTDNLVDLRQSITVVENNISLYDVLVAVSMQTNLNFVQVNENIHVKVKKENLKDKAVEVDQNADINVRGVVKDGTGQPLPGVTVLVKGTTIGTVTELDGSYTLTAPEGAVLVFSFVGYVVQEVSIGNQSVIDVTLNEDETSLDEVVVVGYGTQDRRLVTGAISSIKSEEINLLPLASFDQAMQGRIAGVQVSQSSGAPGGAVTVRVRGFGSISASNEPLYVIDGFPFDAQANQGNTGFSASQFSINPLSTIDPNDIESIDVLKDAAAAAIYGSRGANGVIIITTKKGKKGSPIIDFGHYTGWQTATNLPPLMNAREYNEMMVEARNWAWVDGNPSERSFNDPDDIRPGNLRVSPFLQDPIADTDWLDEIFRTSMMSNYNLSIRGGSDNINYAISGGFFNQDGIIESSGFKRFNLRANVEVKATERLKIGFNFSPSLSMHDRVRTEATGNFVQGSVIHTAISARPSFPVYNEDGSLFNHRAGGTPPFLSNPLFVTNELSEDLEIQRLFTNVYGEGKITDDITIKVLLGTDINNVTNLQFVPRSPNWPPFEAQVGRAYSFQSQSLSWLNENTITYNKKINDHEFSILGGFTLQEFKINRMDASSQNFANNAVETIGAGTVITSASQRNEEWSLVSYLARTTYNYKDKYLFTGTVRTDGSSRFGTNTKYGFFPSVSLGWRFTEESFLPENDILSDGKFRFSYGISGNNTIGNYSRFALLGNTRYVLGPNQQVVAGLSPSSIANDDLGWETSEQFNIGTDLFFANNRIGLLADFYVKNTKDLLLNVPVPVATGFTNAISNVGEVRNWGWEFMLNTVNFDSKFRWTTDFNVSFNKNEIVSLGGAGEGGVLFLEPPIFGIGQILKNAEGQPFSQLFGFKTDGIFQDDEDVATNGEAQPFARPGDIKFVDINGDGNIDAGDRTVIGNPLPDFFYGINNQFSYGNLELVVFLQGVHGGDILNVNKQSGGSLGGTTNQLKEATDRWRSIDDPGNGFYPRANFSDRNGNSRISDRWIEDGSFLRIKNVTIAYNFSPTFLKRIKIKNARIYAQGTNLLTITKYSGFDPEVSFSSNNPLLQGIDWSVYPLNRNFTVGVNLSF